MSELGETVKNLRKKKKWSILALAIKSGISPAALYAIESGRTGCPTMRTHRILAKILGLSLQKMVSCRKKM